MDNKLSVIKELLTEICELQDSSPSSFTQSLEAQTIAEDIIHKLCLMQKIMQDCSPRSSRSTRSSSTSSIYPHCFLTSQDICRRTSGVSISQLSNCVILDDMDMTELERAAKDAYDHHHNARCTRIIENILKNQREISRELFLLCHDSYKKNVEDSVGKIETQKFCEWWKRFLDNASIKNCNFDDELEITDCRTECLWKCQLLALSEPEKMELLRRIINLQIDAYEATKENFRRFHPKCLRRIRKICSVIENFFEESSGFTVRDRFPPCIEEGLEIARIGVSDAKVDAKGYARETGVSNESCSDDICYIESMDLIKEIDTVLYKYLYNEPELVHSDTESDCFISSEEGGTELDPLRDDSNTVTELDETTTLNDKLLDDVFSSDDNESCITRL